MRHASREQTSVPDIDMASLLSQGLVCHQHNLTRQWLRLFIIGPIEIGQPMQLTQAHSRAGGAGDFVFGKICEGVLSDG